ncbi:unnamed protein product [Peniophora sp. CBMAI 1063]|nr:unnamed protein product [Peniophora sp. CBMAI 1063]
MPQPPRAAHAPDSPRSSHSPPPTGLQGDVEMELMGLASALYTLGMTVVADATREKGPAGARKQVGGRVENVVQHLATLDLMSKELHTPVPLAVLESIDNARNPAAFTRETVERAATENQFLHGKMRAVESYKMMLDDALRDAFPEIASALPPAQPSGEANGVQIKTENGA